tara:strand:- start:937 stop:1626 length:690 start_codon:yes stop_codon:yes gene_type:complete
VQNNESTYSLLVAIFAAILVLTNIIGVKIFTFAPDIFSNGLFGNSITLTTGIITYPLTFLITDIVSEIYGEKKATRMVFLGFVVSIISLFFIQLAVFLPGSNVWINSDLGYNTVQEMQNAYESVFTLPGILIVASMTAYLVAQVVDVKIFHLLKRTTSGKHLWLRNNLSTSASQLIDTVIVNSIFLYIGLGLGFNIIFQIIVTTYVFKIIIALLDTPIVYLVVNLLKKN